MVYAEQMTGSMPLLFGKAPSAPDFLRVNLQTPSALALADWLTRACEAMAVNGVVLPPVVTRWIYSAASDVAFVGVMAPSRDAVGRSFPICVMAPVPVEVAAACFPALPIAFDPFLSGATALVHEAPVSTREEMVAQLRALSVPSREAIYAAMDDVEQALGQEHATDWAMGLFGGDAPAASYALQTFATASGPLKEGPPPRSPLVLDCPVQVDLDLLAWLAFAQRASGWRDATVSACWSTAGQSRLLLSLGPPTGQMLQFVAAPSQTSSRLWPLRTDRQAARDEAHAELTRALPSIEELSLLSVIGSLTRGSAT